MNFDKIVYILSYVLIVCGILDIALSLPPRFDIQYFSIGILFVCLGVFSAITIKRKYL